MSDLSNDTKKHTMKSRETIPLRAEKLTFVGQKRTFISYFSDFLFFVFGDLNFEA
jgi:hypothetical protein